MKQVERQLEFDQWCKQRLAELSGPDSWLGMVGLFWLEEGANALGGAPDDEIRLPELKGHQGDVVLADGQVVWRPLGGNQVVLQTDKQGQPTAVDLENYTFFVVDRDGRLAVRVRDRAWALSRTFAGLDYFPYAPSWSVLADWVALDEPLAMEVPNVAGDLKNIQVTHQAVFSVAGETVSLLPMSVSETEIFFVFRDRTSGGETYGAGRFLKALPAVDGKICLDFNFSYNPPCAFTAFATCPLPPGENWLGFAVEAGEKKPVLG